MTTNHDARRTIVAAPVLDLRESAEGWFVIVVSAGPDDDLILLISQQAPVPGALFPMQPRTPCRIVHYTTAGKRVVDLPESEGHPMPRHVQPIAEDEWLIVKSWPDHVGEHNARVYDASGTLLRSFPAGASVRNTQATESGHVWLSYGEEGIYSRTDTLGHNALACLDSDGQLIFSINEHLAHMFHALHRRDQARFFILHSYALNVESDDVVWLYYQNSVPAPASYPLVRIAGGTVNWLYSEMPVHYSRAFAVHGSSVLFAGSYDEPHTLFTVSLHSIDVERHIVVDESGAPIEFDRHRAFGRGSRLYLATEEMLYQVDLADL